MDEYLKNLKLTIADHETTLRHAEILGASYLVRKEERILFYLTDLLQIKLVEENAYIVMSCSHI